MSLLSSTCQTLLCAPIPGRKFVFRLLADYMCLYLFLTIPEADYDYDYDNYGYSDYRGGYSDPYYEEYSNDDYYEYQPAPAPRGRGKPPMVGVGFNRVDPTG